MKKSAIFKLLANTTLFLFFLLMATGLSAQAKLSVQGLLKKSDGTSLPDGNYDLTFRFYDAEVGGSALEAVTVNTEVNGGVYSAVLSGFTSLTFAIPYYVSVAVNGGTELLPRIALTAAPYAISLQGQNNKFPSIGLVEADAIDVAGALNADRVIVPGGGPATGVAGAGYSFGTDGDQDGGLFSLGDNKVALYANAIKALEASGTGVVIPGNLQVGNGQTVSQGQTINGGQTVQNGQTVNGGQTVNDGQTVNGNSTVNGNAKANAFRARGGAPGSSGVNNNGYAFEGNGGDNDSGMYSGFDGVLDFYANNTHSMRVQGSGVDIYPRLYVGGELFLNTVQNAIDGHNLEWSSNGPGGVKADGSGRVSINTSTRRFKHNIVPLKEDFTQILHLEPKRYTRTTDPSGPKEIGYIAEEVDSLGMKCLVLYEDADKKIPLGINYKKMVMFTNEIVKMHQVEIEKLKAEVGALTAEKNALGAENAGLRTDLQKQQADFGKQLDEISRRLRSLETAASNR